MPRQVTDETAKAYHFVPFADKPGLDCIRGHHKLQGYCGLLKCVLTAETPLHVATGLVVPSSDLATYGDIQDPDCSEFPLVSSHYRVMAPRKGAAVRAIPATSLKGAVRSVVEAVSDSCLCCGRSSGARETRTRGGAKTPFETLSKRCGVRQKELRLGERKKLCPACRIFGAFGFEGHVRFGDARQQTGTGRVVRRPVPEQPNRRGTFLEKYHANVVPPGQQPQWRLRGRKFYHRFDPLMALPANHKHEVAEVCDVGSTFEFTVRFDNLTKPELGVLLVGLCQHPALPTISIGASKPFGYGAVSISIMNGEVVSTPKERRAQCLDFETSCGNAGQAWASVVTEVLSSAMHEQSGLVNANRLEALAGIWDADAVKTEHGADTIALWQKGQEKQKPHP